jgi:hypothetical protein
MRSRSSDVEVDVLGQRGCHHAFRKGLDQEVLGLLAEALAGLLGPGASAPQQLVAHVERGVGPGALRQVADDRRDPVVPGDEEHVALADVAAQRGEVVPAALLVAGQGLGQEGEEPLVQPAPDRHLTLFDPARREAEIPRGHQKDPKIHSPFGVRSVSSFHSSKSHDIPRS